VSPILEIKNVSKRFKIHHQGHAYLSFRDKLTGFLKPSGKNEEFWALKDVSFEVAAGDSVGIIGKNGAGKSTLLKILSRITPPTSGRIIARGRVASLLEVGTGFHQELTGRENIFMNGAILGMKNVEIKQRFEEIVDFSGVAQFLDTPLKHYSSGMQLRLAFAVAANLEPEILIVDEVLAVGDAEFQKKCIGKMEDVRRAGRTILFVSHNLDAVESLCKRSILLANGKVIDQGRSEDLIRKYLAKEETLTFQPTTLSNTTRLVKLSFPISNIQSGEVLPLHFTIEKMKDGPIEMTDFCLLFYNYKRQRVAVYDLRKFFKAFRYEANTISFDGKIDHFNLIEGTYDVGLYYGIDGINQDVFDLVRIRVKNVNNSDIKPYDSQYRGFAELF
jgi:lipopolysaccharide transport system ATP-binding protein